MDQFKQKDIYTLIVDDEEPIKRLLQQFLAKNGYSCFTASNGEEALEILGKESVDVVITDIAMPKMDGIKLTKQIKKQYEIDVIMMTGHVKDIAYREAITQGASDFIQKPLDLHEVLIRLQRVVREQFMRLKLNRALQESQETLNGLINTLSSTIEARDPYTSGHQKRVTELAIAIAEEMELSEDKIAGIRMAGVIHDLGKIAIPAEILSKPSRLSEPEFNLIKSHSQVGYDILKNIRFPLPIANIVHQHHERMNGSGYPLGIAGNDILIESRVIGVADVVEAMSSHRPYRPSLGIDAALEEIMKDRGTFFDPDAVNACLKIIQEKKFKFEN